MVGEGPDILAETPSVIDDVQGEWQLLFQPFQVCVDAGRLPVGVGKYGAVGDAVELAQACHEGEDC